MTVKIDVWLRGSDFASTESIAGIEREPPRWTDSDVRQVLHGMLDTMHRLKHPADASPSVSLRGVSWIVNPYEQGGVVIAIEIGMGAAVAGPFDIEQSALEAMITRVLTQPATSVTVH
jgi:hypothetical protein